MSRAVSAGTSGKRGRVERSVPRVGRSRNIGTYCVRSCKLSCHVSMYFFMYRTQASGASNHRISPSAIFNATSSASRRPLRHTRASSRSGNARISRRKLTARKTLGSLPGAQGVASTSSRPEIARMSPFASACACRKRVSIIVAQRALYDRASLGSESSDCRGLMRLQIWVVKECLAILMSAQGREPRGERTGPKFSRMRTSHAPSCRFLRTMTHNSRSLFLSLTSVSTVRLGPA